MDPNYIRVGYCRFADDFVVSVTGPVLLAKNILDRIHDFLKNTLHLDLNMEKTKISSFQKPMKFLGAIISSGHSDQKPVKLAEKGKEKRIKVRVTPRISFQAPIKELIEKLVVKKFLKWCDQDRRQATPTARRNLVNLDHANILLYYNTVIRGLLHYYSFADNRKSMGSIIHMLKLSCALTLALKYKLRTAAKVFSKYKALLRDPISNMCLSIPKTFIRLSHTQKFESGTKKVPNPDDVINKSFSNKDTKSNLNQNCIICEGSTSIEMHHIRSIKALHQKKLD